MTEFWSAPLWINGKADSAGHKTLVHDPGNNSTAVGEMAMGTAADVDHAVQAAALSWRTWAQTSPHRRGEMMTQVNNYIEQNLERLSRILVMESGKLLSEAKGELVGSMGVLRYYASLAEEVNRDKTVEDHRGTLILTRQPVGVVSVVVPWNSPIYLGFLMLAPALMAGNCVLVKPSSFAPLTLTQILMEMSKHLPEGVLNIVPGSGATVGSALVTHPQVRKVSFTGSTEVGKTILRDAASTVKNVTMELGGNDAAIILEDAVVEEKLARELLQGVFSTAGQICYAVKRIYVHQSKYSTFLDMFMSAVDKMRVGHGLQKKSSMGPVNNKQQFDFVNDLVARSRASGAHVEVLGDWTAATNPNAGFYILPTVIHGVQQGDPIVQQEQFGPVIPILPFDTENEAIALANDTVFGLGNSVWSEDVDHAVRVARRLQSGSVFVNVHRLGASGVDMPFGGFKHSGVGRGHGVEALHEQMELQSIIYRTDM